MFKVGDRVVAVSMPQAHKRLIGKLATIVEFGEQVFDFDPKTSRSFYARRFRLAEPDTPFNSSLRAYISKELPNG